MVWSWLADNDDTRDPTGGTSIMVTQGMSLWAGQVGLDASIFFLNNILVSAL